MSTHVTVLLEEAVELLNVRPDGTYVDCTLGRAGHSELIASRLGGGGRLIAFDQDETAIVEAGKKLAPYAERVTLVHANFRRLSEKLRELGVSRADGILFDLGVSSPQLDEAERGFSYRLDAELDMRMDRSSPLTAFDIVNEWPEEELAGIIFRYGEEKFARRIARAIAEARKKAPIRTTGELAELVKSAIPAAARRTGGHPAKRTFQAIRIAVNDELGAFEEALEQAIGLAAPGGRIAVITFHSLEDRICKTAFASRFGRCVCPPGMPVCGCGAKGEWRWAAKLVEPSAEELANNPRARSAKLRVAERI